MSDFLWTCDPYRIYCTYLSPPTRLIPLGLQFLIELRAHGFQILIASVAHVPPNLCMSDSTWPCAAYLTGCTYCSTPSRLSPHGLNPYWLMPLAVDLLTASIPPVLSIHAWVTPHDLAPLTELSAHTFLHQLVNCTWLSYPYWINSTWPSTPY